VRCWIEEFSERKEGAGGEDGKNEDSRDDYCKPARMKQREEQEKEFIACDGSPIDGGVEVVR
jgi:hypothetical protein